MILTQLGTEVHWRADARHHLLLGIVQFTRNAKVSCLKMRWNEDEESKRETGRIQGRGEKGEERGERGQERKRKEEGERGGKSDRDWGRSSREWNWGGVVQ